MESGRSRTSTIRENCDVCIYNKTWLKRLKTWSPYRNWTPSTSATTVSGRWKIWVCPVFLVLSFIAYVKDWWLKNTIFNYNCEFILKCIVLFTIAQQRCCLPFYFCLLVVYTNSKDSLNLIKKQFLYNVHVHVCDVDCLPVLNTLNLSHNRLSDVESLEHLAKLHTVSVLDLAHNKIEDPKVIEVFEQMQNLVSLNPWTIYSTCYVINFSI